MNNYLTYNRLMNLDASFDPSGFNDMDALHQLKDFARTHCTQPVKVYRPNHFTGVMEYNYFPCGCCPHCRNAKSNDLSTRIQLDSRIQGNVYFITLTYSSVSVHGKALAKEGVVNNVNSFDYVGVTDFGDRNRKVYRNYRLKPRVLDILMKNVLHYDNLNHRGKYAYSPCILDMNDFSGFMKRLRKQLPGYRFQFVAVGEYGHKYGRPHMHALLTSDKPVSLSQFRYAWSIYGCPIGTCYVDDLVHSSSSEVQHSINRAAHYVCKYLFKNDFTKVNQQRLKFAYDYYFGESDKLFYLDKESVTPSSIQYFIDSLNLVRYETDDYDQPVAQLSYVDFLRLSCKRARYSVGTCFGSLYLSKHLGRFLSGNEQLPKALDGETTYPGYFVRKVRQYKYPISIYKKGITGSGYTTTPSVPLVVAQMEGSSHYMPFVNNTANTLLSDPGVDPVFRYKSLVSSDHVFNSATREHYLYFDDRYYALKYDRKIRDFVFTGFSIKFSDLVSLYKMQERLRFDEYQQYLPEKEFSNKIYDLCLPRSVPDGVPLSLDFVALWNSAVEYELNLWESIKTRKVDDILIQKFNQL